MSTATIATTTEMNEMHNHRTADLAEILGHSVCDAGHALETVRAMTHALAEAVPDHPEDQPDPHKVRELSKITIDAWREVKMLTAGVDATDEPSMEQIDLEVLALTMDAHAPQRLEKTAESAVEAAGKLFSFHAQSLLHTCPVAAQ